MEKNYLRPDYLFEVSWEICNQIGGIHTILSSKASTVKDALNERYIVIGPDVWRDTEDHPEFAEDPELFSEWQENAAIKGLPVRAGYWKTKGEPIAILIDFTIFFDQKDQVFKKLWELYNLDSISGQWDYIEPTLFGYAAGMTIESFYRFYGLGKHNVVAHFHEWMTGAGLLYLKKNLPQIGTVFSSHATIVGRAIASSGAPFYSKLESYNGDVKAREYDIFAKQSLEKITAHQAYTFVAVSELAAKECSQFLERKVDMITPNGFDFGSVSQQEITQSRRETARKKLLEVTRAMTGAELDDDTLLISTGGRYEFRNKGFDLFIETLGNLNKEGAIDKPIVAFILVPASQSGPMEEVQKALNDPSFKMKEQVVNTHNLHYADHDPIMQHLKLNNLNNSTEDKVKVVYVPTYLRGNDGVINLNYYDILSGFDLTVFPSYYEPWGYTPMESLIHKVPTITTSLSGYGTWIHDKISESDRGAFILERDDTNDQEVIEGILKIILDFSKKTPEELEQTRLKAQKTGELSLWKNIIDDYWKAYGVALERSGEMDFIYDSTERVKFLPSTSKLLKNIEPQWRRVVVQQQIPESLKTLVGLSKNLWWSWNEAGVDLFRSIDPELWEEVGENPILLLDRTPYERLLELESNKEFMDRFDAVYESFKNYMNEPARENEPSVSYFSMEFGLHNSLKTYSGGLGLLAGDYLKEASDYNYNMVGIGLLYRYGYFHQVVTTAGEQIANNDFQDFTKIPVTPVKDANGQWKEISLVLPGRTLHARIWKAHVGRVPLYLLDADYEANKTSDRQITYELYGGDEENRFKQELLLGIGGVRALRVLGINTDLYHLNEGHAAFTCFERLREYILEKKLTYPEAREMVRATNLFTTHTPVPAGHDSFHENMMRTYLSHYPDRLSISWRQLMNIGKVNHDDPNEKFSMSTLAVKMSQEVNGVSKLHGAVSRDMFAGMWKGYMPDELHIGHVTNGVHLPTWLSDSWRNLYLTEFGKDFLEKQEERKLWKKIHNVSDAKIWGVRDLERKQLVDFIRGRLLNASSRQLVDPKLAIEISDSLNENALTIGFARRFATYKRANLLFSDIDRLSSIVNNPDMPVQFIFAGKAHPKDVPGQQLIKRIVEISKMPEFVGKIIFLQNYNILLAKKLLHGVDIWLNTPTRPLEASGTSGEKSVMNGGLHFSVLDGWWAEGYKENAGWALSIDRDFQNQSQQDELDAERIYSMLENDILPKFYDQDDSGIPVEWVKMIKNSISEVAPEFTMNRMFRDYIEKFYHKLYHRSLKMKDRNFKLTRDLSFFKKEILEQWENIQVLELKVPDSGKMDFLVGEQYQGSIRIDLSGLSPDRIGVEIVIVSRNDNQDNGLSLQTTELPCIGFEGNVAEYSIIQEIGRTGQYDIGYRIFPKLDELPHRMDFPLVRWI